MLPASRNRFSVSVWEPLHSSGGKNSLILRSIVSSTVKSWNYTDNVMWNVRDANLLRQVTGFGSVTLLHLWGLLADAMNWMPNGMARVRSHPELGTPCKLFVST